MKIADAINKRCCGPVGAGVPYRDERLCSGDSCMAWRWLQNPTVEEIKHGAMAGVGSFDGGYCGLVGRP